MSELRLPDDQLVRLAALIAAELGSGPSTSDPASPPLVDAATVAQALGVDRSWVYSHAAQLGAVRLGKGKGERPHGVPLRFDLERARATFANVSESASPQPRPRRRKAARPVGAILGSRSRSTA
jgi:hypothetical protein